MVASPRRESGCGILCSHLSLCHVVNLSFVAVPRLGQSCPFGHTLWVKGCLCMAGVCGVWAGWQLGHVWGCVGVVFGGVVFFRVGGVVGWGS